MLCNANDGVVDLSWGNIVLFLGPAYEHFREDDKKGMHMPVAKWLESQRMFCGVYHR